MMAVDQRGASGWRRLAAFGVDYGIIAAYLGVLFLVGVLGRAVDLLPSRVTTPSARIIGQLAVIAVLTVVITHATIRTLQDCHALALLEAPPYVVETCRQVHAREVAARKADRTSRFRRWLEPKALDLDPAAADDATILRVLGPYARTEIFAGDDPAPVLVRGNAATDLAARLTDEEAQALSSRLQAAQLPATVLRGP
jgi:hypothetical protein